MTTADEAAVRHQPGRLVAVHDGEELRADAWLPAGAGGAARRPGMVLLHGGAFTKGSRGSYRPWSEFLARNGIVALSADYRLAHKGRTTYPEAIFDAKAAVQHLRGSAAELGVDPDRIGVMGGSAGAYLAAMVGLTARDDRFANPYPDEFAALSAAVDVIVPMAGAFDMVERWHYDRVHRPPDEATGEAFLGGTPYDMRERYYQASPIFHASTRNAKGTKWLIAWGTHDDITPPGQHSLKLADALKIAGALVRLVPLEGAPHFWYMEGGVDAGNPYNEHLGRRLLTFLADWAKWWGGPGGE